MAIAEIIKAKKIATDSKELILDGHKIRTLSKADAEILTQFNGLQTLSFNQTQLNSITELPHIESLTAMELQDNKLTGAECINVISQKCPNLQLLLLAGNKFTSLDEFTALKDLKHLEEFDFSLNPVSADETAEANGRKALFQSIPQLKVVNGRDAEGNEVVFSDDDDDDDDDESEENSDEYEDDDNVAKKSTVNNSNNSGSRRNSLLSEFMSKNYEDDDENEEEDFNPDSYSEDTSDVNDDDDDDDENEPNTGQEDNAATSPIKRRRSSSNSNSAPSSRRSSVEQQSAPKKPKAAESGAA